MDIVDVVTQETSALSAEGIIGILNAVIGLPLVIVTGVAAYYTAKENHRHTEAIAKDATEDIAHDAAVVKEVVDEEEKREPGVPLTIHTKDEEN